MVLQSYTIAKSALTAFLLHLSRSSGGGGGGGARNVSEMIKFMRYDVGKLVQPLDAKVGIKAAHDELACQAGNFVIEVHRLYLNVLTKVGVASLRKQTGNSVGHAHCGQVLQPLLHLRRRGEARTAFLVRRECGSKGGACRSDGAHRLWRGTRSDSFELQGVRLPHLLACRKLLVGRGAGNTSSHTSQVKVEKEQGATHCCKITQLLFKCRNL